MAAPPRHDPRRRPRRDRLTGKPAAMRGAAYDPFIRPSKVPVPPNSTAVVGPETAVRIAREQADRSPASPRWSRETAAPTPSDSRGRQSSRTSSAVAAQLSPNARPSASKW